MAELDVAPAFTTRRDDATVPSPYTPSSATPGKVIAGQEQGLMDDEEFSLSSGPPGQGGTPAGAGRAGKGGAPSMPGASLKPGQNAGGSRGGLSEIAGLAADLLEKLCHRTDIFAAQIQEQWQRHQRRVGL